MPGAEGTGGQARTWLLGAPSKSLHSRGCDSQEMGGCYRSTGSRRHHCWVSDVLTRRLIPGWGTGPSTAFLPLGTVHWAPAHFQHQQPPAEAEQGLPYPLRPIRGLPPSFLRSPPPQALPRSPSQPVQLSGCPSNQLTTPQLLIVTHRRPQAAIGASTRGLGLPDGI